MTEEQERIWRNHMAEGRRGKSQPTVKIDSTLHTFCVYQLSMKGLSQKAAAAACGTSTQFFNLIITGRKKSKEIQKRVAQDIMGFHNWEELMDAAKRFQKAIDVAMGKVRNAV